MLQTDPHFRDLILFHEYFDGTPAAAWAPDIKPAGRPCRQSD
jgi:hypothetical protein